MTNQVTTDAEESETIGKTAIEPQPAAAATAEGASVAPAQEPVTPAPEPAAAQPEEAPAQSAEAPAAVAPVETAVEPPVQAPEPPVQAETQALPAAAAPVETAAEPPARAETPATLPPAQAAPPPPQAEPAPAPAPVETPAAVSAPAPAEESQSNDIDFGAILEQFEQEQTLFHPGELVSGTVIGITDRGVLVDFGYKSEGIVPVEEFTSPEGEMIAKVGEPVEVVIRSIYSSEGAPQLSRIDALGRKVWDDIETAFQLEAPVIARVVDKTKGGLRMDINGVEAFLPGSQIDSRPIRSLDTYIGEEIEAKVIKFSRRRNNIVLSRKVLTDQVVNAQKAETLGRIEVGNIVEGTIKNLTEYGAFVDIGGIDGLLHVTDMSWGRIHHPGDQFKSGDHVQVKILKLDREKEKVSLGYKQLLPDPWSTVVEVYPVDTKLKGIVSSVTDYGVFVELEPGVEGLVHVSEISWSRRAQSPKRLFHKGQEVEVQVLGVDTVEKRISLGMKQFQDNPWDTVDLRYPVGSRVNGRVRNITDFGAFVELEEGIDGLVHVSDISWAKKIKHPKDVLKKDQEVEAIVTNIDKRGQRLSLSMKDLTPSAWEGFIATHRPGDVVRGKVSRFTNFGIFVELGEGLEGLCHISELSDERVERVEDAAQLGQEMDFKILRIEAADQKIGLSHRAVGKDDEPVVDTKTYSSEAKGGMASLGELANLKLGTAAEEAPEEETPKEKKKAKKEAAAETEVEPTKAEEQAAPVEETPTPEVAESETAAAEVAEAEAPPVEEAPAAAPEVKTEEPPTEETPAAKEVPAAEPTPAMEAPAAEETSVEAPAAETTPVAEETAAEDPQSGEESEKKEA